MSNSRVRECKSLQFLCIDSIVEQFDKYCAAYSVKDTAIPQWHFQFLQRMYSQALLKRLSETDNLKDDHLKFIVNKHLKEFDIQYFKGITWTAIEERLEAIGDTFTKLTLSESDECSETLRKVITISPNLETLILNETTCSDDTLSTIAEFCPLLKVLDVTGCHGVTSSGLMNLFKLDASPVTSDLALQTLHVQDTCVDDMGITFVLEHMPSIEVIDYENVPGALYNMHGRSEFKEDILDPIYLAGLQKFHLTTLSFESDCDRSTLNDILYLCTLLCPEVKSLTVSVLTDEDLNLCRNFPHLESIHLVGTLISINSFLETSGMNFKSVELSSFSVSASVLAKSCPKLETLQLHDIIFENAFERNTTLHYLNSFMIDNANFDEVTEKSTVLILNASPNLEILSLPNGQFGDADGDLTELQKAIIKSLSSLKEIDLSGTDVKLPYLETILLSSSLLEKLTVEYCDFIDAQEYGILIKMSHMMKKTVNIVWLDVDNEYPYDDFDIFDSEYELDDSDYEPDDSRDEHEDSEHETVEDVFVHLMNHFCAL